MQTLTRCLCCFWLYSLAPISMPSVMTAIAGFGVLSLIALSDVPFAYGADDDGFRSRIAPILERRCLHCHDDSTHKANLSLASASSALKGGDGGPAIVPGKPDESLLLTLISGDKPAMPRKDKPLSREEVAGIRKWIESGAAWPRG